MNINLDMRLLKSVNLTPNQFSYLYYIHKETEFPFNVAESFKIDLETKGWCKNLPTGLTLRQQFLDLIGTDEKTQKVEDWIQEWRELWPKGVKTMGRLVRGDKQGCLKKMKVFVKQYPEFSKDQIFDLTRSYVYERQMKGYEAMTCADYFINKNGLSNLASMLEDADGQVSNLKRNEDGGGFNHKEI